MIYKIQYFVDIFFNILKSLILCGFLVFFVFSCDYFSQKNLLTFYYHAEDYQKNIVIDKLVKQFQKSNDIKIKAIPYYTDEFSKIINDNDFTFDIIEIDYTNIFDDGLKNHLMRLDSLINKNYIYQNYYYPWLKDYYFIFKNKNLIKHTQNFFLPLVEDKVNFSEVLNISQNEKILGIPINNYQNTIHFLLSLSYLYNVDLCINDDSLSLTSQPIKKIFNDLICINAFTFLGTQSEIEKNFEDGKLVYILGNTNILKKFRNQKIFEYFPITNKLNQQYCYHKSFLAIRRNSKKLENSLNFLKFLTSDTTMNHINNSKNYQFEPKQKFDISKTLQLFENKYYYEINKCFFSILIEQDTTMYSLSKAEQKINKMLKYKKHVSYK
jgi:ABC-type glycerol-3-phosphate transport system substrate-binding protein